MAYMKIAGVLIIYFVVACIFFGTDNVNVKLVIAGFFLGYWLNKSDQIMEEKFQQLHNRLDDIEALLNRSTKD